MLGSPHFDDDLEFFKFYGNNQKLLLGTRFESIAWMTMNDEMYIGTWLPGKQKTKGLKITKVTKLWTMEFTM